MGESFDLDAVDWITAGAIGEPGRRTFYIQARRGHDLVAVTVEKTHVQWLSRHAQELLGGFGVVVTPDDLDANAQQLLEPVVSLWRAGSLGLGADEAGEVFLLEAEELVDEDDEDPGRLRLTCTRDQIVAMCAYAAFIVEAGARESCRFCGRPIDPREGHVCPAANGHGPLTA